MQPPPEKVIRINIDFWEGVSEGKDKENKKDKVERELHIVQVYIGEKKRRKCLQRGIVLCFLYLLDRKSKKIRRYLTFR